tara:strand:- start:22630 stop:22851 length:222 start_codon:yes stop_codon:yes gene_type:complete
MKHSSCMTQYLEGRLVGRELQQMLADYAADGRFERELEEENFNWTDKRFSFGHRSGNIHNKHKRKGNRALDFE